MAQKTIISYTALLLGSCASVAAPAPLPPAPPPGAVAPATAEANAELAARLPLGDTCDFEDARRGFIAKLDVDAIRDADGGVVWEVGQFDFVQGPAPATVNPSLWRQAELVAGHGLFEVVPGIHQVRGYDLSVMTLIEGDTGRIIVDPLTTVETARAALELADTHLGERPVSAVIYTHSHGDHFGGVRGVIDDGDVARGVPVIAPNGFSEEAVSENVLAGNHMSRRAAMMFGTTLPRSDTGHVSSGLGPGLPRGTVSLILPTEELPAERATRTVDGVVFEFLDAGGTEAPSELMFYLPGHRALSVAEVASGTFHNVLTPRGAKVRDALRWSRALDGVRAEYAGKSDVMFASHHWPVWGAERVEEALANQRDVYRYVHDRTLRAANAGAGMVEAAEALPEPAVQGRDFRTRGYYGTLGHNSKAVFQHYFGWWGGVPADYHRLPPEQAGRRYVEAMGGRDAAVAKGIAAYGAGEFRWAAELLNHAVFADGNDTLARDWLAATYEQVAYGAESGAWRSYFLAGAQELRGGVPDGAAVRSASADVLRAVPARLVFDAMATRYAPPAGTEGRATVRFTMPDSGESVLVTAGPDVAVVSEGEGERADATATLSRAAFERLVLREAPFAELAGAGEISVSGDPAALQLFLGSLEEPPFWFPVATP